MTGVEIRRIDNRWIPMPDGARLAARLWLPVDAEANPVPAILEYIPYRKGDYTTLRDATIHPVLAAEGYACLRVDMRGSGESDGVLFDEYSEQERDDGIAVIEWIAAQPWCSGRVGMMGISWGGITALQMAARRPPALKAVIPVGACEDRYYDDGGYYMGCLNGETIGWAAIMFGYNTRPPDPAVLGDRWRDLWLERLETCPHYLEHWLAHQHRDAYWRAGSVAEDYGAIETPVYAVSGWADCWPNTVPRLLERLSAPRKGLMGPWCHRYPHMGIPGPAIDFIGEARRWFDHWLKDRDTGIMDEPAYRAWIMESVPPRTHYDERPGRWVAEETWPSPHIERRQLALNQDGLGAASEPETGLTIRSPQTVGLESGEYMPWFPFGPGADLPGDQRSEDASSLVFDSPALDQRVEILGQAVATLELASDRPVALAAVRLCDLAPDGASTLVTRGIVNLAQRNGREVPEPLQPGERYRVAVRLDDVGYAFPVGHRIRLAISTSYWPMAWPPPEPVTLTLFAGPSNLDLPVRAPRPEDRTLRDLPPPEAAPPSDRTILRPQRSERRVRRDRAGGVSELVIEDDNGAVRLEDSLEFGGLEFGSTCSQRFSIQADDPLSARAEYLWTWDYGRSDRGRGDWRARTRTCTVITATAESFVLNAELQAWEGDTQVASRTWNREYPRHSF